MDVAEFIRDGVDVWNKRDKEAFLAEFDSDCEINAPGGVVLRGRDGAELFWHGYQDAFPDNHITLRTAFGASDRGAEEAVFEGTQTGVLLLADGSRIQPTGRLVRTSYSAVYQYRGDCIATSHLYFDRAELLAQLGVRP
ncbi:ester cyclase [Actinomycetospora endophytica]|uniref:Ester cyclase n=1 Tax=Actinomycetospora endophytica TaxID=2291215 RepID=A0ABS8PFD1_9PSEU|nr:ester cyclase [Actinomycetospora endophytica]MCD2196708.1 ester cyclase [Actinomycetospora endophytica]